MTTPPAASVLNPKPTGTTVANGRDWPEFPDGACFAYAVEIPVPTDGLALECRCGETTEQVLTPAGRDRLVDWANMHERSCNYPAREAIHTHVLAHPVPVGYPVTLTDREHHVVALLGECAGLLSRIIGDGPSRPADLAEVIAPLHAIQHAVLAQAAARAYPALYRALGQSLPGGPILNQSC